VTGLNGREVTPVDVYGGKRDRCLNVQVLQQGCMGQTETTVLMRLISEFESFEHEGAGHFAKKCGVQCRRNSEDELAPPRGNVLELVEKGD
jgi:hypothetical protein